MGLGRRTFAPGEVLTASNVMNYLMDQSVMSFAGTAARGSAIGTAVAEGMVSYLQDLNQVQVYDGSAWRQVYPSVANAGEVIQVVTATYSTQISTTSTSYVTTNLTASITPKSTSNKIIIIADIFGEVASGAVNATLFRGTVAGTNLGNATWGFTSTRFGQLSLNYVDSPNTTSSQTYTVGYKTVTAGQTAFVHSNNSVSSIILMEVVA